MNISISPEKFHEILTHVVCHPQPGVDIFTAVARIATNNSGLVLSPGQRRVMKMLVHGVLYNASTPSLIEILNKYYKGI